MKLVIISGRSGSGKSTALNVLEDAGYYCIDNLPVTLLPSLVEQSLSSVSPEHRFMAVCIDARNVPSDLSLFPRLIDELPDALDIHIIYLDANDSTLIKRFSETRRKHPLSTHKIALKEAILSEAEVLEPIAHAADLHIETSSLNIYQLRDAIRKRVIREEASRMSILFQSFGFKKGVPLDADLVFDARCLPNPYWVSSLRGQRGTDADVKQFLEEQEEVREMFDDIAHYLDQWLPRYEQNDRSYITVAIGCTGGHHRSVYLCEQLAQRFRKNHPNVQVHHRELQKE